METLPPHSQLVGLVGVSGPKQEDPVFLGPLIEASAVLDFVPWPQDFIMPRKNCVAQCADDNSAGVNDEDEVSLDPCVEFRKVDFKARRTRFA